MCGIAGVVTPGSIPDRDLVVRMAEQVRHRGPDDAGCHVAPDIGLGFRRLAIIDLEGGNQPVFNRDGTVAAVFNGEIYNFAELRASLEARGHVFRSKGDAEVIPHLYEERGAELVDEIRGMFAFALWDARRRELLLARDRAGEKPLYYTDRLPGGGFAFGSEIKSILAAGVSREPDREALIQYLFHLYIPPPRSGFADIRKLAPGHLLRYRGGHVEVSRYWRPSFRPAERSEGEQIEGLRDRFLDAVSSRMVADVPVGAFLSGGIDSTAVVAGMARTSTEPVHTFTITFEGFEHYDESQEAAEAARHFGTEHHELRARLEGPETLPDLVRSFDEPFGNPTAILVSSLSAATREHVKVVLTGDGADELFFGYPRYRGFALANRYRRSVPEPLRRALASATKLMPEDTSGNHSFRRAREFLSGGALDPKQAYASWIGYFTPDLLDEVLVDDVRGEAASATRFLDGLFDDITGTGLNAISEVELQSFLPCNVLEYADRMSMAHGLELRAPFVDHHLVEHVAAMRPNLKLRGGTTKWGLRRALADLIPERALRRPKRGLNPPLGAWLAGDAAPMVDELLDPAAVRSRDLVRPDAVRRLLLEQRRGWRDRSLHIWALMVLELWFRTCVDSSPAWPALSSCPRRSQT